MRGRAGYERHSAHYKLTQTNREWQVDRAKGEQELRDGERRMPIPEQHERMKQAQDYPEQACVFV